MRKTPNARAVHEHRRPPERPDDGNAFLPDTIGQMRPLPSPDAEAFAEEFIGSATGAESVREDASDEVGDDEDGGPFIVLDEQARLPTERAERSAEGQGEGEGEDREPGQRERTLRGARWKARGL